MSGLAALLAGHNPPDTYQWHNAAHVADIEHAVEHAGWKFGYLDGWTVEDATSFLKATSAALDLPGDLSNDVSALSGALGDVTCGDHEGTVLLWDGWAPFARAHEQSFSDALRCFADRVHTDRGGKFAVLLRGEGPSIDVPELPAAHR